MFIDNILPKKVAQNRRLIEASGESQVVLPREVYSPVTVSAADADRQSWKLSLSNFRQRNETKLAGGLKKKDKEKLTPKKLAKMSPNELKSVSSEDLTTFHLQFGRELFNETNLADDRDYGSKNDKRAAFTEGLGKIVRTHGDSPVGQEAASMLADYLQCMGRVEKEEFAKSGHSAVAKDKKYGFHGGAQLFRHLALNPGLQGGTEETLQTLHDTKLNRVSPQHKSRPNSNQAEQGVRGEQPNSALYQRLKEYSDLWSRPA